MVALLIAGSQGQICTANGNFDCKTTVSPGPFPTCDYYSCVFYPSLNKWLAIQACCGVGASWNDVIKRCVADTAKTEYCPP